MPRSQAEQVEFDLGFRLPTDAELKAIVAHCSEGVPLELAVEAEGFARSEAQTWCEQAERKGAAPRVRDVVDAIRRARAKYQIALVKASRTLRKDPERWLRFLDPGVWQRLNGGLVPGQDAPGAQLTDAQVLGRIEAALPALRARVATKDPKNEGG